MAFFGNIFTHYKYTTTDIVRTQTEGVSTIESERSGFRVVYDEPDGEDVPLPDGSPFASWKEARRFEGPLPFTFTYDAVKREVLIIEGVRQNWTPLPVNVRQHRFPFLDALDLGEMTLANAFMIRNVPYHWKKGRVEKWER